MKETEHRVLRRIFDFECEAITGAHRYLHRHARLNLYFIASTKLSLNVKKIRFEDMN